MDKYMCRYDYVEEILLKIGRAIRAKEEDILGILDHNKHLSTEEKYVYRMILRESSSEQYRYVKGRYWSEDFVTSKQLMDDIGVSRPKYYSIRKSLLDGILQRLVENGYVWYEQFEPLEEGK